MSLPGQIVADHNFIVATRETGYRSLTAALSELVDNAVQANAQSIDVLVMEDRPESGQREITIAVLDDGTGMSRETLWTSLQFGGTRRFGDRSGLGRFGMGLPNSSVSQTRRLEVYSWRRPGGCLFSYLDVDEVAGQRLHSIPEPMSRDLPTWLKSPTGRTGTLVVWPRCDRLDFRKANTIAEKLGRQLGQVYRHLIWQGLRIRVNNRLVEPVDPLHCHPTTGAGGARQFGSLLTYELTGSRPGVTSVLAVRFTELPIAKWHRLSPEAKRDLGVIGGSGVSVVRAGREIDYGWYLLGAKRRENYDDWWRCEISFAPELDEYFGVTHSKQGITPTAALKAVLAPDLEQIARALNRRVRLNFERVKAKPEGRPAQTAARQDCLLPPARSLKRHKAPGRWGLEYRIRTAALPERTFYRLAQGKGSLTITLNRDHPFYTQLYAGAPDRDRSVSEALEKLLLAAARADLEASSEAERHWLQRHRNAWSDALATFLDGKV
jgi:hypothetical protein